MISILGTFAMWQRSVGNLTPNKQVPEWQARPLPWDKASLRQ